MVDLLERWAALEPAWCRRSGQHFHLGRKRDEAELPSSLPLTWRNEGVIQRAVLAALDARGWKWERGADGTVTVGARDGLLAVVLKGSDFTRSLLDSYVQRLEIEHYLLKD